MGLDTTHDAWRGPYDAFTRWRNALAEAAGYETVKIEGVGFETILIDWGHVAAHNYFGEWDTVPCGITGPDPLLILLTHSDCEGHIEPEHCGMLADRLAELLPVIPADTVRTRADTWGMNVRATTERFIRGCRAAATAGERLEFS